MKFKHIFEVRDSEIDIGGGVHHSHYFCYLQHTRHKYLDTIEIDYCAYAKDGKVFVLLATNTNFTKPLLPKDVFYVTCEFHPNTSRFKLDCYQEIRLCKDDSLICESTNTFTCINTHETNPRKRFFIPEAILASLPEGVQS